VSETWPLEIQVGDKKKIVIDENVFGVLRDYVKTGIGIDELAEKLGVENWSEAYEFIRQVPAWLLWMPPSIFRGISAPVKEEKPSEKEQEQEQTKEPKAEKKRRTRKREDGTKADKPAEPEKLDKAPETGSISTVPEGDNSAKKESR